MEKLPREILEEILKVSSPSARFIIAMLSKNLYEKIRHIPLTVAYNINSKEGVESIGSFFYTSVIHVNIIVDNAPLNYNNLKSMLGVFYCLQSITIKGQMTQTTARRIIASLPTSPSTVELKLHCNADVGSMMKNALQITNKRPIAVIDDELLRKKRRIETATITTPSPLKKALLPLKMAYETSKMELCKIMSLEPKPEEDIKIPTPLINQNFAKITEYTKLKSKELEDFDLGEDFNLDELNITATKLSEKLIECIIQFDNHWFFVTEYEMYVRNCNNIDDCAQESYWLMYPNELEVHLIKKNEKGSTWFEISMFFDRLEFLVTGGLSGNNLDSVVTPFLGPAQKFLNPMNVESNTGTTNVLVKKEGTKTTQITRKLRQYNKLAAKQKWLYRSTKFVKKDFHTTIPLDVHKNSKKINMASVASFLLSKIVKREFKEEDTEYTLNLLVNLNIFSHIQKDVSLNTLKKDYMEMNLAASHQTIMKCFFHLAEGKIDRLTNDDILAVYKGTLANYCRNEDEKKLKRNVHLL